MKRNYQVSCVVIHFTDGCNQIWYKIFLCSDPHYCSPWSFQPRLLWISSPVTCGSTTSMYSWWRSGFFSLEKHAPGKMLFSLVITFSVSTEHTLWSLSSGDWVKLSKVTPSSRAHDALCDAWRDSTGFVYPSPNYWLETLCQLSVPSWGL